MVSTGMGLGWSSNRGLRVLMGQVEVAAWFFAEFCAYEYSQFPVKWRAEGNGPAYLLRNS